MNSHPAYRRTPTKASLTRMATVSAPTVAKRSFTKGCLGIACLPFDKSSRPSLQNGSRSD